MNQHETVQLSSDLIAVEVPKLIARHGEETAGYIICGYMLGLAKELMKIEGVVSAAEYFYALGDRIVKHGISAEDAARIRAEIMRAAKKE